ncbi:MAG: hypothetical protein ABSD74_11060 [Rhizomicrobium sp.]|jgi:hypothetical protein
MMPPTSKAASDDTTGIPLGSLGAVAAICLPWATPVAAVILILPLWLTRLPAMPDFPAHLATFWLLAGGARDPHAAQFYHVEWAFVPNLAAELIVPVLARIVSLITATKLFLSAVIAMWVLGAAAIHKALYGRIGAAPLAAAFFAYNANFMWGFFNYCFGTGLSFLVLAAWIATDGKRDPARLVGFTLAITAIYFCHLFAVATLMVMIGCYELEKLWEERPLTFSKLAESGLPLIAIVLPSFLAFAFLKPHGADTGHLEFNLLSTLDDRASAAIQFNFDQPAYLLFIALFLFYVIGLYRGVVGLHPRMRLLMALLAAAAVFIPEWAMGGWGVDLRLPAVLGVLAFASCEFRLSERVMQTLAAAMILVMAYQSATLAGNWRYYSKQFSEFRTAIANVPHGSRLVTVLDGDAMGLASDQPYWHMAEYAIVDDGDFTPLLFTTKGQHVVQLLPGVRNIAASNAQQGSPPDIGELDDLAAGNTRDDPDIRTSFPYLVRFQCSFDYAVVIHSGGRQTAPPDMLQREHSGSFFSLYRVVPSDDCSRRR